MVHKSTPRVRFAVVVVDTRPAQDAIADHATSLRRTLTLDFAAAFNARTMRLQRRYSDLHDTLSAVPNNAEAVDTMLVFVRDTEALQSELSREVDLCRSEADVLEHCSWLLSHTELAILWSVVQWPQVLAEDLEVAHATVNRSQRKHVTELKRDIEVMQMSMKALDGSLKVFVQLGDFSAIDERTVAVLDLESQLAACAPP